MTSVYWDDIWSANEVFLLLLPHLHPRTLGQMAGEEGRGGDWEEEGGHRVGEISAKVTFAIPP